MFLCEENNTGYCFFAQGWVIGGKVVFGCHFCYDYIDMRKCSINNIVWKEGKYFVAQCLNADVSSFGTTRKDALQNLNEALALYFEETPRPRLSEVRMPRLVRRSFQYA